MGCTRLHRALRHRVTLRVTCVCRLTLRYPVAGSRPGIESPNPMLFSPRKFGTLVEGIAQRISARFPPLVANNPERTVSEKRIEEILEETFAAALQPERENEIGFLGRARLRNALKRQLREIGYDEQFVDFAAGKLIEQLTRGAE